MKLFRFQIVILCRKWLKMRFQKKVKKKKWIWFSHLQSLHLKSGMYFLVMIFQLCSNNWKRLTIHDQFSDTSFTVSVKLWHIKSDFWIRFKITIDKMFFLKIHASFWNHHSREHFHFFLWNWHFGSMKLRHIFTFLCETVKTGSRFHFFSLAFSLFCVKLWKQVQTKNYPESNQNPMNTRFYSLFYVKNEVSAVNLTYFIFYCGTVSRENWLKLEIFFCFVGSKNKTGWWFHGWKLA